MGLKYQPALDGLRAIACVAVVLFHCKAPGFSGGAVGVDVFFVLSGYLITSLLAQEFESAGRIDYLHFSARRARRLVPPLMVMLAAYAAVGPFAFPAYAEFVWRDVLASAAYLTDFTQISDRPGPLTHTWSLSVEAQFYLIWPVVVTLLLRAPRKVAASILLVAWVLLTTARGIAMHSTADWKPIYYPIYWRATGLLLGSMFALFPVRATWPGWLGLAVLAALFVGLPSGRSVELIRWGIPAAELSSLALISATLASGRLARCLAWPPLVFVGLISYSLYLWHAPIAAFEWHKPWWIVTPIVLGSSATLASVSYILLERSRRPLRIATA